jgi:hypothetical protein
MIYRERRIAKSTNNGSIRALPIHTSAGYDFGSRAQYAENDSQDFIFVRAKGDSFAAFVFS